MTLVISNFSYLGPYAWFIKYGRKRWQYKFALLLLIEVTYNMFNFYPVRICAAGLCIWLHRFVYVYVCVYIFGYICGPKTGFWGLNTGKSPASVIYCSLVVFNDQKKGAYYARGFLLGKKYGTNHSINRTEEGFWKIVLQ